MFAVITLKLKQRGIFHRGICLKGADGMTAEGSNVMWICTVCQGLCRKT